MTMCPLVQETNLRLGLPAIITHIIDPRSPLFDLSLEEMEVCALFDLSLEEMEVRALFDLSLEEMEVRALFDLPSEEMEVRALFDLSLVEMEMHAQQPWLILYCMHL